MSQKLKTIIALAGLTIAIIGLVMIYIDFKANRVTMLPISLFAIGVFSSYKVLSKTNHKSRKFKIKEFEDED